MSEVSKYLDIMDSLSARIEAMPIITVDNQRADFSSLSQPDQAAVGIMRKILESIFVASLDGGNEFGEVSFEQFSQTLVAKGFNPQSMETVKTGAKGVLVRWLKGLFPDDRTQLDNFYPQVQMVEFTRRHTKSGKEDFKTLSRCWQLTGIPIEKRKLTLLSDDKVALISDNLSRGSLYLQEVERSISHALFDDHDSFWLPLEA
jgi:hypothetical protein